MEFDAWLAQSGGKISFRGNAMKLTDADLKGIVENQGLELVRSMAKELLAARKVVHWVIDRHCCGEGHGDWDDAVKLAYAACEVRYRREQATE